MVEPGETPEPGRVDRAEELLAGAAAAARHAYAPYSRFAVGAALLTGSGRVFHGCNVENASFGLGVCAERVAIFKAVSEGERDFRALALAVATDAGAPLVPCGACLQVMAEFNPDLEIMVRDAGGRPLKRRLTSLLPQPFLAPGLRRGEGGGRPGGSGQGGSHG